LTLEKTERESIIIIVIIMGSKGKKATEVSVAAGNRKDSNGQTKENDVNNVMTLPENVEADEPPPPLPSFLPLLINEVDKKQHDDSLNMINGGSQQKEPGLEASKAYSEEEGRAEVDDDDCNVVVDNVGDDGDTAGTVQHCSQQTIKRRSLFATTLVVCMFTVLVLSNAYTWKWYQQTQMEKRALARTAKTLRDGNMQLSRYYKRQLLDMETTTLQLLEQKIAMYQMRLQKTLVAETEQQRLRKEQFHRQVQAERQACQQRVQKAEQAYEQSLQMQRLLSKQQKDDLEQKLTASKQQVQLGQVELQDVTSKLHAANATLALQQAEIKSTKEENEKLTAFKNKATVDLEKGRKANRNVVRELETCKRQREAIQKQHDNLHVEKNQAQNAMQRVMVELQTCRTQHANISKSAEDVLRETIATLEMQRLQYQHDLLQVQHVIHENQQKLDALVNVSSSTNSNSGNNNNNNKNEQQRPTIVLEQRREVLSTSSSTSPRAEHQQQPLDSSPMKSTTSASNNSSYSSISDYALPTDNDHNHDDDRSDDDSSSMHEKGSTDEGRDGDEVTKDHHNRREHDDDDKAAGDKRDINTATGIGDEEAAPEAAPDGRYVTAGTLDDGTTTTSTVLQRVEQESLGGSDTTGGQAEDEADAAAMTTTDYTMIQDGARCTNDDVHDDDENDDDDLKVADTVEQGPATMNSEKRDAGAGSSAGETPVVVIAFESMDEDANKEQHGHQDNEPSTAGDDPVAVSSASTHQTENNKGKRNVVNKLHKFWRGLMKRRTIDTKMLDLALD
jgi:hypothetical protein